ncbi:keratin, type I cytoskeletal 18b [Alosa sapidissima]|uniref:keratin, type I cytoskeletal 18b n=1 Tax=Alosa sapidissima TaxID=34773 RepID=UPI001C0825C5|nr:keratin, type I cytoskeletal 18b [Alosa sapidissima]
MSYRSERMSYGHSAPAYRATSVYGGAGGFGARISSSSSSSLRSGAPGGGIKASSAFTQRSSAPGAGGMASSLQGGMGLASGNEKGQMQNLNDRLASYLEKVRSLEQGNAKLEAQIREVLEKSGPETRDYSRYNVILDDLRKQVFDMTVDNARLVLQIDNARLATDDFRVKYESELAIRQSVEGDIAGLKKVIDDTNLGRMNIESEIESVREELAFLQKNHDNEVTDLTRQISLSGVQVDVDAPKGQDLSQVMEGIRANYEKMALKNAEELKMWHENQISDVQVQVTQNTEALQGAQMEKNDLRRQIQTLEIELASQQSLKASLDDTLRNTELRSNADMEKYNDVLRQLEAELAQLRTNVKQQGQDYEALLNMKMKLEAEIATYRHLLDGGDTTPPPQQPSQPQQGKGKSKFNLTDALGELEGLEE